MSGAADAEAFGFTDAARDRIRERIGQAGGIPRVAEATGVPKTTIQKILTGTGDVGAARLQHLARHLGVTLDWIMTGAGGPAEPSPAEMIELPFYDDLEAAAGAGRAGNDLPRVPGVLMVSAEMLPPGAVVDRLGVVRVRGDSQTPDLADRDLVLIERTVGRFDEGLHLVRLEDDLLIKRVQRAGRKAKLLSRNPAYEPIEVDLEDEGTRFAVLARVILAIRGAGSGL